MGFGGGDFFGGPMSLGQFGYMAESEGQDDLVNTPDARFNAALEDIRRDYGWMRDSDIDVTYEVNQLLEAHGIDYTRLSAAQVRKIERALS